VFGLFLPRDVPAFLHLSGGGQNRLLRLLSETGNHGRNRIETLYPVTGISLKVRGRDRYGRR
jgi:hypothetical protein